MKKIYIQPQTKVELAECEIMVAVSFLTSDGGDSQSVSLTEEEYNDEFSAKEYSFDDDF